MKFSLLVHNNILVIRLYGEFNQRTAQKIFRLLQKGRIHAYSGVTFDLTHVSGIDSAGLGIIFLVAHRLRRLGADIYAINPRPSVRNQIERADLTSMVQVFPIAQHTLSAA